MRIKTLNVIPLSEWDTLVKQTYGRPYSFQQQDGCQPRGLFHFEVPVEEPFDHERTTIPEEVNGPEMGVSFAAWLARDPQQKLAHPNYCKDYETELWWERNFYPAFWMVANDLCAKGLIAPGEYAIEIDW
jgi:hypothetical protein